MKKFLIYAITGALLLALVSSLITGFVTRNNTQGDCEGECPSSENKECNEVDSYANAHPAPADFFWAAASAAYQIEGDYEGAFSGGVRKGRGWGNWDYITHNLGVNDMDTGDDGSKFLEKLDEDIALLKAVGINAYRISLSWPRLIPSGYLNPSDEELDVDKWFKTEDSKGVELPSFTRCKKDNNDPDGTKYCKPWQVEKGWNAAAEEMYRNICNKIKEAGMTPMITLYHWDHPMQFSTFGGWRNRKMVDRYEEYARQVFTKMGDLTNYWIVFNEPAIGPTWIEHEQIQGNNLGDPNLHTEEGEYKSDAKTYLEVRHNIVLATHKAFAIVKELKAAGTLGKDVQAGTTVAISPAYTEKIEPAYIFATEIHENLMYKIDYHTSITGEYPNNQRAIWNVLLGDETTYDAIITKADTDEIAQGKGDFLGINFYSPAYLEPKPASETWKLIRDYRPEWAEQFSNGIVYPNALRDFLRKMKLEYGNIPTFVTENGYGPKDASQQDILQPDGSVDDGARCLYVARHIKGVLEAAADGAAVRSYTLWSSHDNLEWSAGYFTRFGSIYVDYENGYARYPKKSYYAYKKIIKDKGIMAHDMCDHVEFKGQKANAQ